LALQAWVEAVFTQIPHPIAKNLGYLAQSILEKI
jgi:hypothetical protein